MSRPGGSPKRVSLTSALAHARLYRSDPNISNLGAARLVALLREIERLRGVVVKYGVHFEDCPQRPCSCGFLAEWKSTGLPLTIGEALKQEQTT